MTDLCYYEVLEIQKGADKTIANARGATALMLAQKFGRVNMFDTLA